MEDGNHGDEQSRAGRILVIDDEEVVHASLNRILGRHAYVVDNALSAREGLEMISDGDYDLVITDLMMPEMNGLELLEALAEAECSVPVLMITGYPSIRSALQALRLGAVDYLPKPFTRQELLAPVRRTLRRARQEVVASETRGRLVGDSFEAPSTAVRPGERVSLRDHSWALFSQDGTADMGIEAGFLASIDPVVEVQVPGESELVEQGYPGFQLRTAGGEEHKVFMALCGQVVDVHREILAEPDKLQASTWLIRIVPTNLTLDLEMLVRAG